MAKTAKKQMGLEEFLGWWFDPKNGKVGQTVEVVDRKKTSKTFGKKISITTKGFHAVTSGCNDLIRSYYGVTDIADFWNKAKTAKLCQIKPARLGVMVYPYSASSNDSKIQDLKDQMGLK